MAGKKEEFDENSSPKALLSRIGELDAALQEAQKKELAAYKVAEQAMTLYKNLELQLKATEEQKMDLDEQVWQLELKIQQLENPQGVNISGLSWLGKIVLLLRRSARPMQRKEIVQELIELDTESKLPKNKNDAGNSISVVLSKALKSGRLQLVKKDGTRGGYYILKEWTDKNGNLSDEMENNVF